MSESKDISASGDEKYLRIVTCVLSAAPPIVPRSSQSSDNACCCTSSKRGRPVKTFRVEVRNSLEAIKLFTVVNVPPIDGTGAPVDNSEFKVKER